ncbi:hypothetical protein [Streptomyces sp. NPDC056160]|uniref:hypothetical protein n=1 Tax=Streptomyces sp. NPDC056160 TaxID=3345731 RepID=UPI0035DD92AC
MQTTISAPLHAVGRMRANGVKVVHSSGQDEAVRRAAERVGIDYSDEHSYDLSGFPRRSPTKLPTQVQEDSIREALRFLHLQCTAHGTFDDDGQLGLSDSTFRLTGGQLAPVGETARLRAGPAHWRERAARLVHMNDLTMSESRHKLQTLAAVLHTASDHAPDR